MVFFCFFCLLCYSPILQIYFAQEHAYHAQEDTYYSLFYLFIYFNFNIKQLTNMLKINTNISLIDSKLFCNITDTAIYSPPETCIAE